MTLLDAPVVDRANLVQRAKVLNVFTIGWNGVEMVVALIAGVAASSASLIGFGLDSSIEVSAALVLTWRLANESNGETCNDAVDRKAQRAVAVSFAALALYVGTTAIIGLVAGDRPDVSVAGIVIAALSLVVMPVLAASKRRIAHDLGSRAAEAEAHQTNLCALLSAALLVGLGAHAVAGWWWADGLAALAIALAAAVMAQRTWTAESLEDTCCG